MEGNKNFQLTLTQRDIFFDQLHNFDNPMYNIGGYLKCSDLDIDKICVAHKNVILIHDAFGLRIVQDDDGVKQYINENRNSELPILDFSDEESPEEVATKWLDDTFKKPMELFNKPLCFAYLLKLEKNNFWYVGLSHHLAMDGWGFSNWAYKLAEFYNDTDTQKIESISYSEMAQKDQDYISSSRYQLDKSFWLEKSYNFSEKLLKPHYISNYNNIKNIPSTRYRHLIDRNRFYSYQKSAEAIGVGIPQFFLAILTIYFSSIYNKKKITFGIPAHNRKNHSQKKKVGVYTSISPLTIELDNISTFEELVIQISRLQKEAFRYQKFPIVDLMQQISSNGDEGALYDISFNYLKLDYSNLSFGNNKASVVYHTPGYEKTPLTFTVWDGSDEHIEMQIDYNHAYFTDEDIEQLASRFDALTKLLITPSYEKTAIADIPICSNQEKHYLIDVLNDNAVEYAKKTCIHEMFEEQVQVNPDNVALIYNDETLTYAQLNEKANQLAHYLIENHNIKPDTLVGISVERSCLMVIGILGILKASGSYVALDPTHPKKRLEYILLDTELKVVLSQKSILSTFDEQHVETVLLDGGENSANKYNQLFTKYPKNNIEKTSLGLTSSNLAYVIYTSGSTGEPKGVAIEHRNTHAMLQWARTVYSDESLSKVLVSTSLNFDLSVFEIFAPLSYGGSCVIVSNILSLAEVNLDISLINTVPTAMKALLMQGSIPSCVKVVNLAGEPLTGKIVNDLLEHTACTKVYNLYGPSEDTTYSTCAEFSELIEGKPSIGKIIANSQAFVLNNDLQILPVGTTGQLYLAGDGLARGYLNKPVLTENCFINNPYYNKNDPKSSPRMYKTGDLVRYLEDGNLEFIGRQDEQVKIRGYRIELSEIEYHITKQAEVDSAIVLAKKSETDSLVAFVKFNLTREINKNDVSVTETFGCDQEQIIENIKQKIGYMLPEYMVPMAFVIIDEWPLTPNGKVDKRGLHLLEYHLDNDNYVEPQSETEKELVAIWFELLNLRTDKISSDANFFRLGGNSLLILRLRAEIRKQFGLELSIKSIFKTPYIKDLAEKIEQGIPLSLKESIIPVLPKSNIAPMSLSQQSLWFINQLNEGSPEYNMPAVFEFKGPLNVGVTEQAIKRIIERHESLRTVFSQTNHGLMQIVSETKDFTLTTIDLCDLQNTEKQIKLDRLVKEDAQTNFSLETDSMIRASYICLKDSCESKEGVLLINMHHIASDGYSIAIFVDEFITQYQSILNGEPDGLPQLEIQYSDYAHWERNWLQGEQLDKGLSFWSHQLSGLPEIHNLPLDYTRPPRQTFKGKTHHTYIKKEKYNTLELLCQNNDSTLFMGLQSVFSVLLARHSNETDIVMGTPIVNREQIEVMPMIGFFMNNLVLRSDLSSNPTFIDLLKKNKLMLLDAYAHQRVPFDRIVDNIQPERSLSHSPLFQVMVVLQNNNQKNLELPGIKFNLLKLDNCIAKYDLNLIITEHDQGLSLEWEYNTGIFKAETIERMAGHFSILVSSLAEVPENNIFKVKMLSETEYNQQTFDWNNTLAEYPKHLAIHELFELQVNQTPDAVAVIFENESISYRELNKKANQLANYFVQNEAKPGDFIALCINRSIEMVIGLLGILKAGGAYIPLDPNYPSDRKQRIILKSKAKLVLTDKCNEGHFNERLLIETALDGSFDQNNLEIKKNPEDTAYVIFTSGSTGEPKGVVIAHHSVVNLVNLVNKNFKIDTHDVILCITSVGFDLSVYDIFGALSIGAKLVISDMLDHQDPEKLLQLIESNKVTFWNSVPSTLKLLIDYIEQSKQAVSNKSLRLAFLSGDWIPTTLPSKAAKYFLNLQVIGLGGATEGTVWSNSYPVINDVSHMQSIPYGKPLDNNTFYILDKYHNPVPLGVTGELYIGGVGVAKGYLNDIEKTASSYLLNPFHPHLNETMYKTGDLGRLLMDNDGLPGNMEFLGRIDHQVKIRGFRIELGEIEHVLMSHIDIREAVVLAKDNKLENKILVAYITVNDPSSVLTNDVNLALSPKFTELLRQALVQELPLYMVPSVFVYLESLPITANGKINRKALPEPNFECYQGEYVAPKTLTEEMLVKCWAELLKLDTLKISIKSNFFEIGGNSVLSSQMIHKCSSQYKLSVTIKDIFECPTIEMLSLRLHFNAQSDSHSTGLLPLKKYIHEKTVPLSFTQYRIWFVEQLEEQTNKHNITGGVKINGDLDIALVNKTFAFLVAKHPILKTRISIGEDGQPLQYFDENVELGAQFIDLTDFNLGQKEIKLVELVSEFSRNSFDLYKDILFSKLIVKLSASKWRLFVNFHHIISDGWSVGLFLNEFIKVYDKICSEHTFNIEQEVFNYHDYVLWQKDFMKTAMASDQVAFWTKYLHGCNQSIQLPFSPPKDPSSEVGEIKLTHAINQHTQNELVKLAKKHKATLFNVIHCALLNVLSRLTGERDLTLGIPVTGRNLSGVENLLGAFINNLPIRSQLNMFTSFDQFIIEQSKNVNIALSHQELPFEKIISTIDIERGQQTTPVFQVLLNVLSLPEIDMNSNFLDITLDNPPKMENKFDITLYVDDTDKGISFTCNFNTEKYSNKYIQLILDQTISLLHQVALDSGKPCGSYTLLTPDVSKKQLIGIPDLAYPQENTKWQGSIHALFERSVEKYPYNLAVSYNGIDWTYTELEQLTQAFAHHLKTKSIGSGDVTAIMAQRNNLLIVAILSVLKTGAAFVLIDSESTPNNLLSQLDLISASVVISLDDSHKYDPNISDYINRQGLLEFNVSELMGQLSTSTDSKNFKSADVQEQDLAYLAFTSGTEGQPKIIRGSHSALSYYVPWFVENFSITNQSKFAMLSGLLHDPLQRDIFTPLCSGAKLYIPFDTKDAVKINQWLDKEKINVLNITPSLGRFLWVNNDTYLPSLRLIFSGGELLTTSHISSLKSLNSELRIVNLYGATETCRALGYFEVESQYQSDLSASNIPIGKGVGDCQLIILNENMQQCGIGELGQIGIRSQHLTLGYLNDQEETVSKFITNPFRTECKDRIYLSGDVGRYQADGNVVCQGRKDRQVKIRGFRVELTEIEYIISQQAIVKEVAVLAKKHSGNEVVLECYITLTESAKSQNMQGDEILGLLENKLIDYKMPNRFTFVEELPLTANGKLDTQKLHHLTTNAKKKKIEYPETKIERELVEIWRSLLHRDEICVLDNFFSIGGHSILVTQFCARLLKLYGIEVSYAEFFANSCIRKLAELVEKIKLDQTVIKVNSNKSMVVF
jgi:amino acid adenylation domain-containing protein